MSAPHNDKNGPVVDHTARSMAQRALDRQAAHEKFCEDRARRAESFESEMKSSIALILRKMEESEKTRAEQRLIEAREQAKMQTRQNVMWAGLTCALVFGAKYFMGG